MGHLHRCWPEPLCLRICRLCSQVYLPYFICWEKIGENESLEICRILSKSLNPIHYTGDLNGGKALSSSLSLISQNWSQGLRPLNFPVVFPICSFLAAIGNARVSMGAGSLVEMQVQWSIWGRGSRGCGRGRGVWSLHWQDQIPGLGMGELEGGLPSGTSISARREVVPIKWDKPCGELGRVFGT